MRSSVCPFAILDRAPCVGLVAVAAFEHTERYFWLYSHASSLLSSEPAHFVLMMDGGGRRHFAALIVHSSFGGSR